ILARTPLVQRIRHCNKYSHTSCHSVALCLLPLPSPPWPTTICLPNTIFALLSLYLSGRERQCGGSFCPLPLAEGASRSKSSSSLAAAVHSSFVESSFVYAFEFLFS